MKHPYTQTTDSRAPQWILRAATAPARPLAWLAVLLAVLIALPTVELAAQECIDFEMNPAAGGLWAEGDMVTDQYRISHGISFSVVVDGAHFPDHGPVIAMVGGDDACAFGNGNNPLDYCEDPIDGGQNTVFDNPSYSSVSPFDGTHPPDNPLDDIRCFFLTDHACINGFYIDHSAIAKIDIRNQNLDHIEAAVVTDKEGVVVVPRSIQVAFDFWFDDLSAAAFIDAAGTEIVEA